MDPLMIYDEPPTSSRYRFHDAGESTDTPNGLPSILQREDETYPRVSFKHAHKLGGKDELVASNSNSSDSASKHTPYSDGTSTPTSELDNRDCNGLRLKFSPFGFSDLTYPKSCYQDYQPPLPLSQESHAIEDLLKEASRLDGGTEEDFIEIELSSFSVYHPSDNYNHANRLTGLQFMHTKLGKASFAFDGILSVGNIRRYVQGVRFDAVPIGNYGKDRHSVEGNIWIYSIRNAKTESGIYYKLKSPAPEYERFHKPFIWLADLAKHFVDFCQSCETNGVTLSRFRGEFSAWLWKEHGESEIFQRWWKVYGRHDFCQAVAVNIGFLKKEYDGQDNSWFEDQPLYKEAVTLTSISKQETKETSTIVTPYIYDLFSHLAFGKWLKVAKPVGHESFQQHSSSPHLNLSQRSTIEVVIPMPQKPIAIAVGDVLSVTKDTQSNWKDEVSSHREIDDSWYVYVQGIEHDGAGKELYRVLWLYSPADTPCGKMKYPYSNERFLSDNCNCKDPLITEEEVLCVKSVRWNGEPSSGKHIFIRQTWLAGKEKFISLQEGHKQCEHLRAKAPLTISSITAAYPIGQTVLVPPKSNRKSSYGLEPYEVAEYVSDPQNGKLSVVLRKLLRKNEVDNKGRPNELVYTDETEAFPCSKLNRKCLVRCYPAKAVASKEIPVPYSKDGTGNAFYICSRLVEGELKPIHEAFPNSLIQGFDPQTPVDRDKLQGLDLYCGGGNFGRGLEEGGALHNKWAVDYYNVAAHTYLANASDPLPKMFYGSVNDMLAQAVRGNPGKSDLIPAPGEVDFIAAGSPCQGFSLLNPVANNDNGLRNQSLVASVAAYVDFYRPKYGLLENVLNMAQKGDGRDNDVLSQLICAIVGMGYQIELFVLDAWSCGSPQTRSRIFVAFAAPGCPMMTHPELSHQHPKTIRDRTLGQLSNGQAFGERKFGPTPFNYVSIGMASRHLPYIGDGQVNQSIRYPYHVLPTGVSESLLQQIKCIPTRPRGMNFVTTWNNGEGPMTQQQRELFPLRTKAGGIPERVKPTSRAWGRITANDLLPTVIVSPSPLCARMGRALHWDQDRPMSIAELGIAQGFPEDEVLVGRAASWAKILGNSVCRTVSIALGISLREAWLNNQPQPFVPPGKAAVKIQQSLKRPRGRELDVGSDNPNDESNLDNPLSTKSAEARVREIRKIPRRKGDASASSSSSGSRRLFASKPENGAPRNSFRLRRPSRMSLSSTPDPLTTVPNTFSNSSSSISTAKTSYPESTEMASASLLRSRRHTENFEITSQLLPRGSMTKTLIQTEVTKCGSSRRKEVPVGATIVSLVTSDEEESDSEDNETMVLDRKSTRPNLSSKKYAIVDNSSFTPYESTKKFLTKTTKR
ncbi:hypothetical protein BJ875DRAFT_405092 [Amylocarpus encephaloides]|uniref:DNA (cytosine-5-)-methyltransferase n=1 Tax=Amylocarpus encephaloides TaxID=45428 RepID=A0A9P7YF66_9HELO|nr:hypothetical protein BJ875DRAFT_405092 [Amylocarpus encephaloides]